ncbi:MAG: lysophospholipid acyltransferase family protein [Armatimonadetes bacterium]|nr:lysophospholipid acyltransferase family protein [Armatimonadota bacterium]
MKAKRKALIGKFAPAFTRWLQKSLLHKTPEQQRAKGNRMGRLIWRLGKRRRERCEANLRMAFPEKSESEIQKIAKDTFEHFGRTTVDFLVGLNRTKAELESDMEIIGLDILQNALAEGKGVLLITGHLGHWERCSAWLSLSGYDLAVVARNANQDDVNNLINDLREGPGTEVIARGDAVRVILKKLKAGAIVGILPDQNADEIFLPFFGHPAGTVLGPGVLHERTGAPVIPVSCMEIGNGKYRMEFYERLLPEPGYETKGEGLMRSIHAWLESVIREYPNQWLWFHDRWRNARRKGLL